MVKSPVKGNVQPLTEVNDETFASGIMGKGVAVDPTEGKVFAPGNAVVTAMFNTGHAIGLQLDNDVELLIHIGIDTVSLNGEHFFGKVKKDQEVKTGDLLVEFDLEAIKELGYDPVVMIIVTNSNDFLEVLPVEENQVENTSDLLLIA